MAAVVFLIMAKACFKLSFDVVVGLVELILKLTCEV